MYTDNSNVHQEEALTPIQKSRNPLMHYVILHACNNHSVMFNSRRPSNYCLSVTEYSWYYVTTPWLHTSLIFLNDRDKMQILLCCNTTVCYRHKRTCTSISTMYHFLPSIIVVIIMGSGCFGSAVIRYKMNDCMISRPYQSLVFPYLG